MAQLQRVTVSPLQIQDDCINLTAEQQHYLGRVLRLQINDRFIAMDGQGQSWLVQLICSLPAEGHQARILEPWATQTELTCPITLLTALPKGNGFEEIVRACTELGVSTFMPVISDRTLLHPSPQKIERWRKIAIEATEQSERQVTPQILDPVSFTRALENHLLNPLSPVQSFKYICGARQDFHLWQALHHDLQQPVQAEIAIATGPEGGWTAPELDTAIQHGFQIVSLGQRILRAITAPTAAVSLVAARLDTLSRPEF